MEILFNREVAMKAVDVAKTFAESASGLKVLRGALVSAEGGRVQLTTTDLALWCRIELDAQTPEPGTAVVPVRHLGTVLKNLPRRPRARPQCRGRRGVQGRSFGSAPFGNRRGGIPGRRRAGRTRAVDAADGPPGR